MPDGHLLLPHFEIDFKRISIEEILGYVPFAIPADATDLHSLLPRFVIDFKRFSIEENSRLHTIPFAIPADARSTLAFATL
jgi:hypothetical protein